MLPADETWLATRLTFLIPVILSLAVHEWAHAWTAFQLGDDTAMRMGRLTLNPLAHIDPVGTLILPLVGIPFGWAKPVPVEPLRFARATSMRTGMLLTAAAGPLSNLLLAAIVAVMMGAIARFAPAFMANEPALWGILHMSVLLNVLLAVFNILPIPPLDGSRVMDGIVPRSLQPLWDRLTAHGPVTLVAALLVMSFLGLNLLAWPVEHTQRFIDAAVATLAR